MRRSALLPFLVGALFVFAPGRSSAQQASGGNDLAALRGLAAHPSSAQRDRATISDFLDRSDVSQVAREHGIDTHSLKDRVATLDDADAADVAAHVRRAESHSALAGGDTFVITSTTIIVALLVAILILVA